MNTQIRPASDNQIDFVSRLFCKCLMLMSILMLLGATAHAQVLPKQKSISDKKGRSIDGAILAIEKDHIVFKKTDADKEIKIPTNSLSEADQKYVLDLENFIRHDVGIEFITIGNPGNDNDPKTGNKYGKIDYVYEIGKYQVTNEQYAKFLNAKAKTDPHALYDERMNEQTLDYGPKNTTQYGIVRTGSNGDYKYSVRDGFAQKPVVWIDWFRAARFCNWMSNGQGDSDTETGSYTLNGKSKGFIPLNDNSAVRLPTEDEWYKATYYNPVTSNYSAFPGEDQRPEGKESTSFYHCIYQGGVEPIDDIFDSASDKNYHRESRTCRTANRGSDKRFIDYLSGLCNVGGSSNTFRIVRMSPSTKQP